MNDMLMLPFVYVLIFASASLFVWGAARILTSGVREYEEKYLSQASSTLSEMFIFQDPKRLLVLNILCTVALVFLGLLLTRNPVVLVFFGAAGFLVPKLYILRAKKKRLAKFREQFVDGLLVLSNALRSGRNLVQALETLEQEQEPPISQEFGLVIREVRVGVSVEDSLENLANRIPDEDLRLLVTSVNIVRGMGGNLTEIFDSMSYVIQERHKLEGKTRALTAQGRMQGIVVGLLPLFLGIVMYLMDPASMTRLFTDTMGNLALAAIVVMEIIGFLMIRKVTRIEV